MSLAMLPIGRPRKGVVRPVPPCAACETTGGACHPNGRPARYSGERYGVDGVLCNRCRLALLPDGPSDAEPTEAEIAALFVRKHVLTRLWRSNRLWLRSGDRRRPIEAEVIASDEEGHRGPQLSASERELLASIWRTCPKPTGDRVRAAFLRETGRRIGVAALYRHRPEGVGRTFRRRATA